MALRRHRFLPEERQRSSITISRRSMSRLDMEASGTPSWRDRSTEILSLTRPMRITQAPARFPTGGGFGSTQPISIERAQTPSIQFALNNSPFESFTISQCQPSIQNANLLSKMTHQIVAVIGAHANWAGPIMFALSFGESFAFFGLLFPGTAIMVAAGAFIPGGTLSFWPLVIGCLTGSIAGDAISFWLGRRYGHLIGRVLPFSGRPELLARGFAFFERHGGQSVFLR